MEIQGLTDSEVHDRVSRHEVNSVENAVSRTYFDIITKNIFTVFNLLIFTITALLLYFGEPISAAAAVGIIVMNILIATVQEIRAKRRLDKIALLMRPKVVVVRNGTETEIDQSKIVKDDVIHLRSGDQALVDGVLIKVRSLEVDESLLTGESKTVRKKIGDPVYSGSYCITGEGHYQVTAFGDRTFAAKMLASAKKFDNKQSPLQMETGAITKLLMIFALVYLAVLISVNLYFGNRLADVGNLKMAVVILDIVPIGLFLMIVIAYMIAAMRMSDSGVLLQRANSVESMSHVDTVCMDKTGTITTNKLIFKEMTAFGDLEAAEYYMRMFASVTGSPNKTIDAVLNRYGRMKDVQLLDEIMFSSERKFSAVKV
ncbi:MAG: HAD-IC family P-type ATPase, partial [Methanomassiliicoccaceae archaeon]|nr:HAD-IC family P-type ATPase [Methanomassiliicoccaceae archaeon]